MGIKTLYVKKFATSDFLYMEDEKIIDHWVHKLSQIHTVKHP